MVSGGSGWNVLKIKAIPLDVINSTKNTYVAVKALRYTIKIPLEDDPFVCIFEYGHGATKEGSWVYD